MNPDAQPEMAEVKADKPAMIEAKSDNIENISHTPRKELHPRTKKTKHGDRAANKGDGSLVLVWFPSCASTMSTANKRST